MNGFVRNRRLGFYQNLHRSSSSTLILRSFSLFSNNSVGLQPLVEPLKSIGGIGCWPSRVEIRKYEFSSVT